MRSPLLASALASGLALVPLLSALLPAACTSGTETTVGPDPGGDPIGSSSSGTTSGNNTTSSGGSSGTSGTSSSSSSSSSASSSGTPSQGCGAPAPQTGFVKGKTLKIKGQDRTYNVAIPTSYDPQKKLPVIFAFHGDGGNGDSARNSFKFETAHANEAIFVYPDGLNKTWLLGDKAANGDAQFKKENNADVLFVEALIEATKTTYCVDENKVFVAGFSRGGFFANHVGCILGGPVKGLASHGGGDAYDGSGQAYNAQGKLVCPGSPVPALIVIGQNDGLLSNSKRARDYWKEKDSCQDSSKAEDPVPCLRFDGCAVKYCEVSGLGHQVWQNATQVTWDFFAGL